MCVCASVCAYVCVRACVCVRARAKYIKHTHKNRKFVLQLLRGSAQCLPRGIFLITDDVGKKIYNYKTSQTAPTFITHFLHFFLSFFPVVVKGGISEAGLTKARNDVPRA